MCYKMWHWENNKAVNVILQKSWWENKGIIILTAKRLGN